MWCKEYFTGKQLTAFNIPTNLLLSFFFPYFFGSTLLITSLVLPLHIYIYKWLIENFFIIRAGRVTRKEIENNKQRKYDKMSHIAVERNRRRQMNEHLKVLRSLTPCFYIKRVHTHIYSFIFLHLSCSSWSCSGLLCVSLYMSISKSSRIFLLDWY